MAYDLIMADSIATGGRKTYNNTPNAMIITMSSYISNELKDNPREVIKVIHLKQKFTGRDIQSLFYYFQPVTPRSPAAISARERTVFTPASSNAANFSAAVPLPPAIMAPA